MKNRKYEKEKSITALFKLIININHNTYKLTTIFISINSKLCII